MYKLYKLPLSFVYDGITANQIVITSDSWSQFFMDTKEQLYMDWITKLKGKQKPLFLFTTQKQYMLSGCEKNNRIQARSPSVQASAVASALLRHLSCSILKGRWRKPLLYSSPVLGPPSQVRWGDGWCES